MIQTLTYFSRELSYHLYNLLFTLVFIFFFFLVYYFDFFFFFFFQAEDGIRDLYVTGVQTCALPICSVVLEAAVVGLIASLLGLLGGLALAPGLRGLLSLIGADLPSTASVVETRTVVVALVVGVLVTVLASLVPALRATRIAPVVALREGLTAESRTSRKRIVFAALLLLVGAGIMAYGLFGGASG